MAIRRGIPKHPGQRGSWVELEFMSRASFERLLVSVPWGQQRWDVGVEFRSWRYRVQIKSALHPAKGTNHYRFHLGGCDNRPYTPAQIDFLALYLIEMDLWYIIPVRKLRIGNRHAKQIQITPGGRVWGRWQAYEERWDLLRGASDEAAPPKKAAPKKKKKKKKKKKRVALAAPGLTPRKRARQSKIKRSNSQRGEK